MKKLLATGFCLLLGLSLVVGCGGGGSAVQSPPTLPPPPHSPPPPSSHLYLWDSAAGGQQWLYTYALPITTTSIPLVKVADGGSLNVMAFDPTTHRLFVTQNQSVSVFTPPIDGSNSVFDLATTEANPQDVKVTSAGDAFVSGTYLTHCRRFGCTDNVAVIDVFSAPVTSSSTVNFHIGVGSEAGGWTRPVGIAMDGSGNLWAGTNATMFEYTAPFSNASVPSLQFPIGFDPSDLAFDTAGNMYAAASAPSAAAGPGIVVYTPPFTASTTKAFTINTGETANYLAFDAAGNLYVTVGNVLGYGANPKLLVFSPPFTGTSVPVVTLTLPGNYAAGIAIGPPIAP